MTLASVIRFAAPLLLTVTLAGCLGPYGYDPYYRGNNYSAPYYGGSQYSGSQYGGSYYGGAHYGGSHYGKSHYGGSHYGKSHYGGSHYGGSRHGSNAHADDPSRSHRTHRQDGDGDVRRHHRAPERSGRAERSRRDSAERPRERRRTAVDRADDRTGKRFGNRSGNRTGNRAGNRTGDRRRPAAERQTRRAERPAQQRRPAPRRYANYRGSGETGADFSQRVERARRQADRESIPIERVLADGPAPEK